MAAFPVASRAAGSFRDPSGYVFVSDAGVFRSVNPSALSNFDSLWNRGVIQQLVAQQLLIPSDPVPADSVDLEQFRGARGELPARILRHPRVPFFTYPYEWTFSTLQEAAAKHLDLQIAALDLGAVLSDATPYNMQWVDGCMMHVDVLSLRPYSEGEMWLGYNQFCRLFLLPLLVEAWNGAPFQPLLRGAINGIRLSDAVRILPFGKRWLTLNGLLHVTLHASREQAHAAERTGDIAKATAMPRNRYRAMLTELRQWIAELKSRRPQSFWNDYAGANSYDEESRATKRRFIGEFVKQHGIRSVWDLGGNSGDYSVAALEAGAQYAVVMDSDLDALERARSRKQAGLIPVVMDCGDPSPSLGWAQSERAGMRERANADAVLALALTHHISISGNVPPRALVEWLVSLAPRGVVEFVPKQDSMVARMLSVREDVFHDYTEEHFLGYLRNIAEITRMERLATGGRVIIAYVRK